MVTTGQVPLWHAGFVGRDNVTRPVVLFWGFGGNNWETQAATYEISYLSGRISDENSTARPHLA